MIELETNMPDIGLLIADTFPERILDEYYNELNSPGLNLQIHTRETTGIYANLDWTVPTLIAVFISKSYFDSFFKKMGEQHFQILDNWIKKTSTNTRSIKAFTIPAAVSTEKVGTNTQSKIFSVETITNTKQKVIFLFDTKLSEDDWNFAIERMLQIMREHFENGITDQLTIDIKTKKLEKTIFARIKIDPLNWEFIDMKGSVN